MFRTLSYITVSIRALPGDSINKARDTKNLIQYYTDIGANIVVNMNVYASIF